MREAVERTVQATLGGAQQTRGRAQDALDEVVSGAEASAKNVRARVRKTVEATRPATSDDIRALRLEIAALGRRLDALEGKPASRSGTRSTRSSTTSSRAKRSSSGSTPAKRSSSGSSSAKRGTRSQRGGARSRRSS
jgi:hypothetical protein